MKKILTVLLLCFILQSASEARDYAKLHMKELKHAQKYGTANTFFADYSDSKTASDMKIKDPGIFKIGNYEVIPEAKYKEKLAQDNEKYSQIASAFKVKKADNYNLQAYGRDYYKVYRVAERLIRANNLDFVPWRMGLKAESDFNAFNANTDYIEINSGALDTLYQNEDALALLIGHEMGHALLGHGKRTQKLYSKIVAARQIGSPAMYASAKRKYLIECKNMEYAADVEGAKIAARAGYDLDKARETLNIINTMSGMPDYLSDHPDSEKRLKNYAENRKYFVEQEWAKQGRYNIYNSDVLNVHYSSDRRSIVLSKGKPKKQYEYYRAEFPVEVYARCGYKSYVNGEFKDAINYFKKVLKEDKSNPIIYLYTSYAYECLYNKTGKEKCLTSAKEFANYALRLAPDNKYIKQQAEALK